MKRIIFLIISLICIFTMSSCSALIALIAPTLPVEEVITKTIAHTIYDGSVTVFEDTHGGFHGDGWIYAEIKFRDDQFLNDVRHEWKPLPLTDSLNAVCYGTSDSNGDHFAPHIKDGEGNARLPDIKNGYYYFKDNYNSEYVKDRYDDSEFLHRSSVNYTLAIYDTDTKTLYVFKFDT